MWPRILELERRIEELNARLAMLEGKAVQTAQWVSAFQPGGGGGGDGGASYWCISPGGGVSAATGTWPSITPASFTADVYKSFAGSLTAVATGANINWYYKDADPGNRLVALAPCGDGSYDALVDSCTRVDV